MIPVDLGAMKAIDIKVVNEELDWNLARDLAWAVANRHDEDPMLMAWFDKGTGKFSPSCCKCEIKEGPAWEIYGKNHGGRLRIAVNDGDFVFIYT